MAISYKNPFIGGLVRRAGRRHLAACAVRGRMPGWSAGRRGLNVHKGLQRTLGEYIAGVPGGDFAYSENQLRELLIDRCEPDILWNDATCNDEPAPVVRRLRGVIPGR